MITIGSEKQIEWATKISASKGISTLFSDLVEQLSEMGTDAAATCVRALTAASADAKFWIDMQQGQTGTISAAYMIEKFLTSGEIGKKTADITGYTFQEYLRAANGEQK